MISNLIKLPSDYEMLAQVQANIGKPNEIKLIVEPA